MSNHDSPMTRFLFAILKQKNLKDIDWNKVAHDPILAQEITNGHAARMRYSRFRSSMLGLEPQRRNKKSDKNKIAKPKKESKSRRDNIEEENIKCDPESLINSGKVKPDPESRSAARIKQENSAASILQSHSYSPSQSPSQQHMRYEAKLIPMSEITTQHQHQSSHRQGLHHRLLTPSSDSDLHPHSHAHIVTTTTAALGSPESLLSVASNFDQAATVAGSCINDQAACASWQVAPGYSTNFDAAFYTPSSSCEQARQQQQQRDDEDEDDGALLMPPHTPIIKHESWESHFPPV